MLMPSRTSPRWTIVSTILDYYDSWFSDILSFTPNSQKYPPCYGCIFRSAAATAGQIERHVGAMGGGTKGER